MKTPARMISLLALAMITLACSSEQTAPTPPAVTEAVRPTVIVVVTNTPTPESIPEPGQRGTVIYDDGKDILSIDLITGDAMVLLSREELQTLLEKDRSAESYTYGAEKPISIALSPDRSQALITICADLDARYRCLFTDYVYTLASKTWIQLPVPPDAYGVYWQWSPDGSTLAGAAWTYDRAIYSTTAFYTVNNDGTNLTPLGPIVNNRWQMTWNPKSRAIHPLSFIANFQFVFTDRSEPEDIALAGLDVNDSIECLTFSPDGSQAVFSVRRSVVKNREGIYLANSSFSNITQLTEYDINSRYFCDVIWSPDGRFVHVRYEYDTRAETGEDNSGPDPRRDKLINVEIGTTVETPRDLLICGWTPDNNLIYETRTKDGGIQVLSPGTNVLVEISDGVQAVLRHCPIQWLSEE